MKIKKIQRIIIAAGIMFLTSTLFAANGTLTGSGTSTDPFIIADKADWNKFASNVNSGTNADKFYKLSDSFDNSANPVTLNEMCGNTESYSFKGSFDGNGKTLYINLTNTEKVCGPFRYVKDASINNLTVTGTITTSAMDSGGFIGQTDGTVYLNNCISTVTITSSVNGDGTHGGFVGISKNSTLKIYFNNCKFAGKLLGEHTNCCGGFVGWNSGTSIVYNNCFFDPLEITISVTDSASFNRNWKCTLNNCYVSRYFGAEQGIDASEKTNEELLSLLGENWLIKDNTLCPLQKSNSVVFAAVNDFELYYNYTGNTILLNYSVSFYDSPLIKDTDYYEIIQNSEGQTVTNVTEKGLYYLVVRGKNNYVGEQKISFKVIFSGTGLETDPYLIETLYDWDCLVELTNKEQGDYFSQKYFRLENDLDFAKQ